MIYHSIDGLNFRNWRVVRHQQSVVALKPSTDHMRRWWSCHVITEGRKVAQLRPLRRQTLFLLHTTAFRAAQLTVRATVYKSDNRRLNVFSGRSTLFFRPSPQLGFPGSLGSTPRTQPPNLGAGSVSTRVGICPSWFTTGMGSARFVIRCISGIKRHWRKSWSIWKLPISLRRGKYLSFFHFSFFSKNNI